MISVSGCFYTDEAFLLFFFFGGFHSLSSFLLGMWWGYMSYILIQTSASTYIPNLAFVLEGNEFKVGDWFIIWGRVI